MNLYINNQPWKILFVCPDDPILYIGRNSYTLGVTIPFWYRIYIANTISGELLKRVISHEIAHAEFCSRGLNMPIYVEECLADIVSDNIVDTNNQTYNICKIIGKC